MFNYMQHFLILHLPEDVHCNEKSSWAHAACYQSTLFGASSDFQWFSRPSVTHLILLKNTPEVSESAAALQHFSAVSSASHPVLVVTGRRTNTSSVSRERASTSEWVKTTHSFQDLLTEGVRPLMVRFKIIRLLVPTVLVPVASLLRSPGSPCSLSHDDLRRTRIHTLTSTTWRLLIQIGPHQLNLRRKLTLHQVIKKNKTEYKKVIWQVICLVCL